MQGYEHGGSISDLVLDHLKKIIQLSSNLENLFITASHKVGLEDQHSPTDCPCPEQVSPVTQSPLC